MTTIKLTRTLAIAGVGAVSLCAMMVAQKSSIQPQPQADKLAAISVPSRGNATRGAKPDDVLPTVPAGFSISVYAELPSPRMMVYAPNGDLFVSSPASNTITVLRDAMDVDDLSSPALYFGTTTGQLWIGRDSGERWECLFDSLPPIHCVKVAVV